MAADKQIGERGGERERETEGKSRTYTGKANHIMLVWGEVPLWGALSPLVLVGFHPFFCH